MKVTIINEQDDLALDETSVLPIVEYVLACEKRKSDEVTIYFVSEEEITRIHKEFFNDPSPTDCISFPLDQQKEGPHHILGEIFICPKVALDYVMKEAEEVNEEPYRETTLYLVHSLLHLLGYRDDEDSEREKMHATQNKYLSNLIKEKTLLF